MSLRPMRPLLWFARLVGVNPTGPSPDFKISKCFAAFFLLQSFGTLAWASFEIVSEVYTLVMRPTDTSLIFGSIIHINGMAVVFLGHAGMVAGALRKMRHFPELLRQCNALPGPTRSLFSSVIHSIEIAVILAATISTRILVLSLLSDTTVARVGDAVLSLIGVSTADQLLFLHLATHLGTCFRDINGRLRKILADARLRASRGVDFVSFPAGRRPPSITRQLCRQRELHILACELLAMLTLCQCLTMIVVEFVLTVVLSYCVSIAIYNRLGVLLYMISFGVVVAVCLAAITAALIGACRSTCKKGNETVDIVHDMLNCEFFDDSEVRQLMLFSMQTAHAEVAITPHGLFKMDISLTQGFATTVVLYVVMLLQFGSPVPPSVPNNNTASLSNATATTTSTTTPTTRPPR